MGDSVCECHCSGLETKNGALQHVLNFAVSLPSLYFSYNYILGLFLYLSFQYTTTMHYIVYLSQCVICSRQIMWNCHGELTKRRLRQVWRVWGCYHYGSGCPNCARGLIGVTLQLFQGDRAPGSSPFDFSSKQQYGHTPWSDLSAYIWSTPGNYSSSQILMTIVAVCQMQSPFSGLIVSSEYNVIF
jgi:hypothetical protein